MYKRLPIFICMLLFVSIVSHNFLHAQGFRNASVLQIRGHFHEAGLSDTIIYISGLDTVTTDTVRYAGYGYFYAGWKISQAGDSIAIIDSLYISQDGVTFSTLADVNRIKNYCQIYSLTAPDTNGFRVPYPNGFLMYHKLFSTADTGDSAQVENTYTLDP